MTIFKYKPVSESSTWSYHYQDALLAVKNNARDILFHVPCKVEEQELLDVVQRVINVFDVGYSQGRVDDVI